MGKVIVTVVSDNVPTDKLYDTVRKRITSKEFLVSVIRAKYGILEPDIRMYIQSDED